MSNYSAYFWFSKEQPKNKKNNLTSSDNPFLHGPPIEPGNVPPTAVDDSGLMNKPKDNENGSEKKSNFSMASLLKSMKSFSLYPKDAKPVQSKHAFSD